LAARDLRAVQPARHPNLDALAAETQLRIDRLPHRAPERHALLELQPDRLRHQLRVELGLVHFLDVDEDLALGLLRHVLFQLLDLGALASDDDARTRGPDRDPQLIAATIHYDLADAHRFQPRTQRRPQRKVFLDQLGVAVLDAPSGRP